MRFGLGFLVLIVLVLTALVTSLAAQNHASGWVFTGSNPRDPRLGTISPLGVISTLIPGSAYPPPKTAVTMDLDNRTYVVVDPMNGLLFVDASGRIVRSVSLPPCAYYRDVMLDSSGDYLVLAKGPGSFIFRVNRGTLQTTTLWADPSVAEGEAFARDVATGDFMIVGGFAHLYRLAPDGSSVASFASVPGYVAYQVDHDLVMDAYVLAGRDRSPAQKGCSVFAVTRNGQVARLKDIGMAGQAIGLDRASSRSPRYAIPAYGAFLLFDVASASLSTLATPHNSFFHVRPDRGLNLATQRLGKGYWSVNIDFPGEGGLAYVLAVSMSGIRPAVPLPDGRRICLLPDALTRAGLAGHLFPMLTGDTGYLDGVGRARATIDVSRYPIPGGIPIWLQVVTLDPKASFGMRTIADPVHLRL